MQRIVRPGLLLLAGCGGSVGIGTREEGSLGDVLQIVQAVGVVTELAAHGVLDAPENEPTCPRVSRIEGFSTVDYGEGCLPDSGLVPAGLSGSARLDIGDRVSADLEGVLLGSVDLYGVLDARATPVSAVDMTLRLGQVAPDSVEMDLTIGMGQAPPFIIHGAAQRNAEGIGQPLEFDEVELQSGDGCLSPSAGSITIEQGLHDVTFTFDGEAMVLVSRSDGEVGEMDVCAHDRPLNEE